MRYFLLVGLLIILAACTSSPESGPPSFCSDCQDLEEDLAEQCLFACADLTNDTSYCALMEEPYGRKGGCYNHLAFRLRDSDICTETRLHLFNYHAGKGSHPADDCMNTYAKYNDLPEYCRRGSNWGPTLSDGKECLYFIAIFYDHYELCYQVGDQYYKNFTEACLNSIMDPTARFNTLWVTNVASYWKDSSLCEYIDDGVDRIECEDTVLLTKNNVLLPGSMVNKTAYRMFYADSPLAHDGETICASLGSPVIAADCWFAYALATGTTDYSPKTNTTNFLNV